MDNSVVSLAVVSGLTVLGLLLVALIWKRASVKAVIAWLGISLVPMGLYLLGLIPLLIDGYQTLAGWWPTITFTIGQVIGLSLVGLAALLLLVSRLVPHRPRKRKDKTPPPSTPPPTSLPSAPPPPRNEPESTLILDTDRRQTW